jgi:hypothetical protein
VARRRRTNPNRPSASKTKPLLLAPPGIETEQLVEVLGLVLPLASVAPFSGVVGADSPEPASLVEAAPALALEVGLPEPMPVL